jgi:hypothetical protein
MQRSENIQSHTHFQAVVSARNIGKRNADYINETKDVILEKASTDRENQRNRHNLPEPDRMIFHV